ENGDDPKDESLDWGSESQEMNFRISYGGKISAPTGLRDEYEFVAWYTTPDFKPNSLFNKDIHILNADLENRMSDYDKATDYTDDMDKWGTGATYNKDDEQHNNRWWITKKLDLYAKWVGKLKGAKGINVEYYGGEGAENVPTDETLYKDTAEAVAMDGCTAPPPPPESTEEPQEFQCWVVQTWDEDDGEYVDTGIVVYPGSRFTVRKENAKIEELDGSTEQDPKYKYTVRLRAKYKVMGEEAPTHIYWFPNYGENKSIQRNINIKINEAVDIPTPEPRAGYEFLGWAKVTPDVSGSTDDPNVGAVLLDGEEERPNLTESDLFLTYGGKDSENKDIYYAMIDINGTPTQKRVTQVAADEKSPYDDLYAVWKRTLVDLTVEKIVDGPMGDTTKDFSFTLSVAEAVAGTYTGTYTKTVASGTTEEGNWTTTAEGEWKIDSATVEAGFSLKDGENIVIKGLPAATNITVTETDYTPYTVKFKLASETGNPVETATKTISINANDTITVTNFLDTISPTGVSFAFAPYALMLACGVLLLLVRRKRRA
ncbi:MAG: hypothetical protein J5998_10410, partial [Clostridia bacterium]|nr:hypothetical protein [Clostridia bacterium]